MTRCSVSTYVIVMVKCLVSFYAVERILCQNFTHSNCSFLQTHFALIGPGSFILIRNPSGIVSFMNKGAQPIMECPAHLIPVQGNLILPSINVHSVESLSGFVLHNVSVNPTALFAHNTNCHGKLCDKQRIVCASKINPRCPCIQMLGRDGVVCIVLSLKITMPNGTRFTVMDFSSEQFLMDCVLTGPIPAGVKADHG